LTDTLTVQANGNQRFVVPVRLAIAGGAFQFAPAAEIETLVEAAAPTSEIDVPAAITAIRTATARRFAPVGPARLILHALPAVLLLFVLAGIAASDLAGLAGLAGARGQGGPPKDKDRGNGGGVSWNYNIDDRDPLLGVDFNRNTMRFGIQMLKEELNGEHKKLTFGPDGGTNNTCVKIDGSEHLFGKHPFAFEGKTKLEKLPDRQAWRAVMVHPEKKIRVTQFVEVVPGEQSRLLDTCLIYYKVENYGTLPHTVGLRVLLDTFIGANDGVPFVIPGQPGLLTDARTFTEKEIPDYIEALENNDPQKPGTVARLGLAGLKLPGADLEPVNKMIICHWPDNTGSETKWEPSEEDKRIPITGGSKPDSCVFLYWSNQKIEAGDKREMAFTYGLGKIAVDADSGAAQQIGLSAGGAFRPGGVFTVTAYLKGAKEGQKVTIKLPNGVHLADKQQATQDVPLPAGQPYSQVSWRLSADANGEYRIQATSEANTAGHSVKIRSSGLFD
jgi:hypothetical protein